MYYMVISSQCEEKSNFKGNLPDCPGEMNLLYLIRKTGTQYRQIQNCDLHLETLSRHVGINFKLENPFAAESGEWQKMGFCRDISMKKKVKGEMWACWGGWGPGGKGSGRGRVVQQVFSHLSFLAKLFLGMWQQWEGLGRKSSSGKEAFFICGV